MRMGTRMRKMRPNDWSLSPIAWAFLLLLMIWISACTSDISGTNHQTADQFTVPDSNDSTELVTFIEKIMSARLETPDEAKEYEEKAPSALMAAAERILELEKDPHSERATFARTVHLQMRIVTIANQTPDEQSQVYKDVFAHLATIPKPERHEVGLGVQLAQRLEKIDHPSAGAAYQQVGELLSKHEDHQMAEFADEMLGKARRLNLIGNSLELTGTTLDGMPFNVADWKGKVVLVDFWATWCDPCIAEIPRVEQQYQRFHDQGFEVVGVSLDANRSALEKFVSEREIPWTIVHENDGRGGHPAADHYQINAIPFMALIDREGKVVSIQARGDELERLLEEQFAE